MINEGPISYFSDKFNYADMLFSKHNEAFIKTMDFLFHSVGYENKTVEKNGVKKQVRVRIAKKSGEAL